MNRSKAFIAAAVVAVAGCGTQMTQSGSGVQYGANSTGTTPGWENTNPWPNDPSNAGYASSRSKASSPAGARTTN